MQKQWFRSCSRWIFSLEFFLVVGGSISKGLAADAPLTDHPAAFPPPAPASPPRLAAADEGIWDTEVGRGFRKGTHDVGFALTGGLGLKRDVVGGSYVGHDVALATVHYGRVFSGVLWQDHWFQGNFQWLAEGFAG
ncbi:MAG: Orn/DAP/Arg decarboxylase 2, partial [Pedosphaera sp.]|nr:Orn/DAP/Arg decarboxylase 2 [Pedosphaera sp.]